MTILKGISAAAVHVRSSALPKDVAALSAAWFSAYSSGKLQTLPDLAYDYAALERAYNIFVHVFVLRFYAFLLCFFNSDFIRSYQTYILLILFLLSTPN
jgi:hypothetical protein